MGVIRFSDQGNCTWVGLTKANGASRIGRLNKCFEYLDAMDRFNMVKTTQGIYCIKQTMFDSVFSVFNPFTFLIKPSKGVSF